MPLSASSRFEEADTRLVASSTFPGTLTEHV
jgi:hypothetical protein